MWALLNDAEDAIEELIQHPKTMTIDGIKHPRQMFKWTTSELKAVGIVPVTTSGTSLNSNYYIETNEAYAIANDKASVVRTIGVKTADRKLADTDEVDEDGYDIPIYLNESYEEIYEEIENVLDKWEKYGYLYFMKDGTCSVKRVK